MPVPVSQLSGDIDSLLAMGYTIKDGIMYAPTEPGAPSAKGGGATAPAGMAVPAGYDSQLWDLDGNGIPDNLPPNSGLPAGSGPHPSDPGWQDENGDGVPDPPPGLTGLPPSGPASTLPGNPGIDQTDANKNGTPDIYEQGPGSPGYAGSEPAAPMIDRDGNGIDDRNQTTVGQTGPVGPDYADWWAQTLAANPQLGYGGNGQMGWGGAMTTGTGAPIELGGGGGGYGGGTAGGGNYSLPGAGGDFTIPPAPTANFPDLTQIGTGVSAGPGTGTGTGGFTIPPFENPLAGYGTTGTGTTGTTTSTGTAPLAGYGSTGASPNAGLVSDLANSYQNQTNAANQANMSRYDQGLAALLDRMNRAGLAINNLTNEGIADIGRQFEGARATADQDLINRGLANTTVRSGVMRGLTTDQAAETNRYWDNQARQNLNEDYRQTGDIVNWIGGRNDVAPSTGDLANLASGVGAAGPTTTTGTPSTTPAATQPAVNLPPQVTTALQNGTLMNYAPTQSGAAPATTGNSFLNQGAGISTPEQLSASVNSGAVTRSQTAAPPPPATAESTPLAGYGEAAGADSRARMAETPATAPTSTADLTPDQMTAFRDGMAKAISGSQNAVNSFVQQQGDRSSAKASAFGSTPAQMGPQSSINPNLAALNGDPNWKPPTNANMTPVKNGWGPVDGVQGYRDTSTMPVGAPGSTNYQLPGGYSGETANNPTGTGGPSVPKPQSTQGSMSTSDYMLGQTPGMVSGGRMLGGSNDPSAPKDYAVMPPPVMKTGGPMPPPPSSPSVMGFPDPQGTGMAPGNPNDVRESMRAQNPNNKQLQGLMDGADSWMKGYGQTDPGYRFDTTNQSQSIATATPQPMNPTQASAPPPSLGKVPQRPEPVPFASTPPVSPMSGYGSSAMPGPSMMAPPGPAAAPTFQQYGAPGVQYKPPSLVGGVMMPQPPARRWGV